MAHVIALWDIPSLAVKDSKDRFPVRRIFCVGRNYVEHQKEMGGDGRETPFFFIKSAHALVPGGGAVHYPPKTANFHYESEMVVAIGTGGRRIEARQANEHIYGYGVGLDLTRRDLQQLGKDHGRPWDFGKDFDEAAPCSALAPTVASRATSGWASGANATTGPRASRSARTTLATSISPTVELSIRKAALFKPKAAKPGPPCRLEPPPPVRPE